MPAEDELDEHLTQFKLNVTSDDILEMLSATNIAATTATKSYSSSLGNNYNNDDEEDSDDDEDEVPVKQTRASAAARGGKATRGKGKTTTASKTSSSNNSSRSPAGRVTKHTMPALETSRATVSFFFFLKIIKEIKFIFIVFTALFTPQTSHLI